MYVMGIDTATLVCSVAVVSEEKILAEYTQQVKKNHSERLLPLIDTVLRDIGLKPRDLDGVAVAGGPGSFTGLRIGMVTAKALGQSLELPLCSISTLAALAKQHPLFPGLICPILDARREQVYNAIFAAGTEVERLVADRALSVTELIQELRERSVPVLFVGDAVPVYRQTLKEALASRACFMPPESATCRASSVARLGLSQLRAGQGQSWRDLQPFYLRRSEAEVKYQQLQAKGGGSC